MCIYVCFSSLEDLVSFLLLLQTFCSTWRRSMLSMLSFGNFHSFSPLQLQTFVSGAVIVSVYGLLFIVVAKLSSTLF